MAREALLALEKVSKRFPGGVVALDGINLEVARGEFLSLLGPSGCGKTTTLRLVAGFEAPTSGRILLDGRDITALRPFDRPVNTVFQDYALFPHLNVEENVAFGLSVRHIGGAERKRRVGEALALVGLSEKAGARVQTLSGGQRQRVALSRALVCEPRILLLDEPLSALDAHLREQMRVELKRLQTQLDVTFILVTHDQTEALSISDRIAVMNQGRIEQVAPPSTLYDRPATKFVARFIGTMNLFDAATLSRDGEVLRLVPRRAADDAEAAQMIAVRPEDLLFEREPGVGTLAATVSSVVFHGPSLRVHAELASGTSVIIDRPRKASEEAIRTGDIIHVSPRPGTSGTVLSE
jgi:spermidine/putrescine transport system ATP-binding protein